MSTSRDSRIGLPLSIDSSTASSRDRSWIRRAMRKRYLARSLPGIVDHTRSYACRAAATARSTSSGPASTISANGSSVAGLTVLNRPLSDSGSTNSPPMNSPYDGRMSTIAVDSGAGAYSKIDMSVQGHVVGSGVPAGGELLPLHQQIVEKAGRAEAEVCRVEPAFAACLVHGDEIADRVLRGPDATGGLDDDLTAGCGLEVPCRLQHDERDRQRGGRLDLARRRLDEVSAGQHREPRRAPDVVIGGQLTGLEDDLEVRRATRLLDGDDLVVHLRVTAGQERATVDDHVDLIRAGRDRVGRVGELDAERNLPGRERCGDAGYVDTRSGNVRNGGRNHGRVHADRRHRRRRVVGVARRGKAGQRIWMPRLRAQRAHLAVGVSALER